MAPCKCHQVGAQYQGGGSGLLIRDGQWTWLQQLLQLTTGAEAVRASHLLYASHWAVPQPGIDKPVWVHTGDSEQPDRDQ